MNRKTVLMAVLAFMFMAISATQLVTPVVAEPTAAMWTEKTNYEPNETVAIFGTNFGPNVEVNVMVSRPDMMSDAWSVGSDAYGNFTTTYQLNGILGLYNVTATDGARTAVTWFSDGTYTTTTSLAEWASTESELSPDANTVLLDHLNGATLGTAYGPLTYSTSIPDLVLAANFTVGTFVRYDLPSWYFSDWHWNPTGKEGTIECWINLREYGRNVVELQWYKSGTPPWAGYIGGVGIGGDGKLRYGVWVYGMPPPTPPDPNLQPVGATVMPLNEWTYVAASWGPAGTKLYVNGNLDGYSAESFYPAMGFYGQPYVYVYVNWWGTQSIGYIDELHISKVQRTDAEIYAHYLQTRPPVQRYLIVQTEPIGITTIPGEGWYDISTDVSLQAPAIVPVSAGVQYRFDHWAVDGNVVSGNPITVHMDADHTATAHYVTQYLITFDQTCLDVSAIGTVVTVDGSTKTFGDLPFSMWVDSGATVSYTYEAIVSSSTVGKRFRLDSVTGLTSPITVTGPTSVIGNYVTQYCLTVVSPYDTPGGEGWYDKGETAYATLAIGLDYVNSLAHGFVGWTVNTQPWGWDLLSEPIIMSSPKTATANWEVSPVYGDVRTIGFWKHQVNVWYFTELVKTGMKIRGIGTAQISEDMLIAYLAFIDTNSDYFRGKIVKDNNGDGTITNLEILQNAYNFLKTPTGTDSMKMRAEQQLLALWLNLAYKAFFWNTQLNQDILYIYYQYTYDDINGLATIGEAILFCEAELTKTDGNYEAAKNICDSINNNLGIIWGT